MSTDSERIDEQVSAAPGRASWWESAVRWFQIIVRRHGHKLWWVHSVYALALGAGVIAFAQRGFRHARWLTVSLGLAWLLVVFFFRVFGTGAKQQNYSASERGVRIRFLVMTYALKNLYQGMLFFLLPFYWKSASMDATNRYFVVLLAACAVLSTIDVVFDRFLMRWRYVASVFYAVTLFGCINLIVPAFLPNTRTLITLMTAGATTMLAFWTLHVPIRAIAKPAYAALLVASVVVGAVVSYRIRVGIPPVPMYVSYAAVGPSALADGRLAMEVRAVNSAYLHDLVAVTDVISPGGSGDRLRHVWRHEGTAISLHGDPVTRSTGTRGSIRLRSTLVGKYLPRRLAGHWTVDVETDDDQLVGRVQFDVTD